MYKFHTDPLDTDYLYVVAKGLSGGFGSNERAWCVIPVLVGLISEVNKGAGDKLKYHIAEQSINPFNLICETADKIGLDKFCKYTQDMVYKMRTINKSPYVDTIEFIEL